MTGITVVAYESLVRGGGGIGRLDFSSWQHEAAAFGGWLTATCDFACVQEDAADWFENGIGRRIVALSAGSVVWEGFVDEVTVRLGLSELHRGPLLGIANRVKVFFALQAAEGETVPPEYAGRLETLLADNAASQERYGIVEKYISIGTLSDDYSEAMLTAEQARDTTLVAFGSPALGVQINTETTPSTVTLKLAGYVQWLRAYQYANEDTSVMVQTASDKVLALLAQDPNGFIAADTSGISENPLLVNSQEDWNAAAAVLEDVAGRGGAGYQRYVAGVYEGRRLSYGPAPTAYTYVLRIKDAGLRLFTPEGVEVPPWEVRPARWVFVPDFMLRGPAGASLAEDPRYFFIESLTYTVPNGLELQSGVVSSTQNYLRSLGIVAN